MTAFFVAGVPAPQGSMRGFVVGKRAIVTADNARTKPWRSRVGEEAQKHFDAVIVGPVAISAVFVMPRLKTMPKSKTPPHTKKPDADKLLRATCDALKGIAYNDDAQVNEIHVSKHYAAIGEQSGLHISITEAKE